MWPKTRPRGYVANIHIVITVAGVEEVVAQDYALLRGLLGTTSGNA